MKKQDMQTFVADLTREEQLELMRILLADMPLTNIAPLICWPVDEKDSAERAAAEKIADHFAEYASEESKQKWLEDRLHEWAEADLGSVDAFLQDYRTEPPPPEGVAEALSAGHGLDRDEWLARFLARLGPAARADLGRQWVRECGF